MKLIDVRKHPRAQALLYCMLEERRPEHSISHRVMPTRIQHNRFVDGYGPPGDPYKYWALIEVNGEVVGNVYLTSRDEIGIHISGRFQGKGYGPEAVELLMRLFGDREYLANIAPGNDLSIAMFREMDFHLCQLTFRREARRYHAD